MAQVLVRNLKAEVVEKLKARARKNGRSLQSELREILKRAAETDLAAFRADLDTLREEFAGRTFSDSAQLIREDRDR